MNIEAIQQVVINEFDRLISENDAAKRLHSMRLCFEPYIYNYLIQTYGAKLDEVWKTYIPPKKSKYCYVIIERRPHPNFWFILRNIAWAAPFMSVYIICSDTNINFVKALVGDKVDNYNILPLFNGSPDRETAISEYNSLLKDYRFYSQIDAEYMLTIQMDVFIRKQLNDNIFTGDYWGCPWGWQPVYPGGGGATVRRIQFMIDLCKKFIPYPDIKYDMNRDAEDFWISKKCLEINSEHPSLEFRKNTIMENIPVLDPYIIHQFWTYFGNFASVIDTNIFKDYLENTLKFSL